MGRIGDAILHRDDMATVYRKTAKGQQEIETRANRLLPRMRTALILVDGRRDDDELRKLVPGDPDDALRQLLEGGYVEPVEAPQRPAGRAGAASRPGGLTQPGGFTMPGGLTQPGGLTMPGALTQPGGSTLPSGLTQPAGLTQPGGLSRPAGLAGPGSDPKAFEAHRRAAVRMLNEKAGPMAEAVAVKLEKCRDWNELLPALQLAQRALGNVAGSSAAKEFGRRFIESPPA